MEHGREEMRANERRGHEKQVKVWILAQEKLNPVEL
jgi:hypothetical protein